MGRGGGKHNPLLSPFLSPSKGRGASLAELTGKGTLHGVVTAVYR